MGHNQNIVNLLIEPAGSCDIACPSETSLNSLAPGGFSLLMAEVSFVKLPSGGTISGHELITVTGLELVN